MHGNRFLAVLAALGGVVATAVVSWIVHTSGTMQGTSADGREKLAIIAIAVHVLGVVGFGLFAGGFFSRKQRLAGCGCVIVMLGAAAYSVWQIASFTTAETVSTSSALQKAEKDAAANRQAALDAAKARQEMQAALAKEQLLILKGEMKATKGRSSRKDIIEAGNKLVADMVGSAPVVVTAEKPAGQPVVQTASLPQIVGDKIGWAPTSLQAAVMLWGSLWINLIEMLLWPLASYFWRRAPVVDAMPIAAPQTALEADPPRGGSLVHVETPKALPAPETAAVAMPDDGWQPEPPPPPKPTKTGPLVRPPRVPISAEARDVLAGLGMPEVKPVGPVLERQAAAVSAERFSTWLKCIGESGRHSTARLMELYAEFCAADHREPLPYGGQRGLAAALDNRRFGVSKARLVQADGSSAVEWIIGPFRPRKAKEPKAPDNEDAPAAIDPRKPETMPHNRLGPMTPSKQAEYEADLAGLKAIAEQEVPPSKPRPFGLGAGALGWSAQTTQRPDGQDLAWLRFQEKAWRRTRIENRHQHGRRGRRSAA